MSDYKEQELHYYRLAHEAKQKARSFRSKRMREEAETKKESLRKEAETRRAGLIEIKNKRDEEIRGILLPFAEALKAAGWSIKVGSMTHFGNYNPLPVFILSKEGRDIPVSYRKGVSFSGFEWD